MRKHRTRCPKDVEQRAVIGEACRQEVVVVEREKARARRESDVDQAIGEGKEVARRWRFSVTASFVGRRGDGGLTLEAQFNLCVWGACAVPPETTVQQTFGRCQEPDLHLQVPCGIMAAVLELRFIRTSLSTIRFTPDLLPLPPPPASLLNEHTSPADKLALFSQTIASSRLFDLGPEREFRGCDKQTLFPAAPQTTPTFQPAAPTVVASAWICSQSDPTNFHWASLSTRETRDRLLGCNKRAAWSTTETAAVLPVAGGQRYPLHATSIVSSYTISPSLHLTSPEPVSTVTAT